MRRAISNQLALVTKLATSQRDKTIEAAGGFHQFGQPNREMRRRMEREARSKAKKGPPRATQGKQ